MTWQALEPQALARTAAIFTQTPLLKPAKYLRPGWDAEVFGCTLQEYVGTAQLVWVSAIKCAGRFDLALFDTPDGQLIARHLSRDTVTRVLDTHFATSTPQFRAANHTAEGRAGRDGDLRRYTYNPLRGRPLLTGFGADYLCPMPQLAWDVLCHCPAGDLRGIRGGRALPPHGRGLGAGLAGIYGAPP